MSVTNLRHPSRTGKVTVVHRLRAIRFGGDIDAEDYARSLAPIGSVRIGIKQAKIVRQMTFVVGGELLRYGRAIIESHIGHDAPDFPPALTN